jgi:outer membrane protein assembly factor BamB
MRNLCLVVVLFTFGLAASGALAQDWPQWRGPNRDGVCPDSTILANTWPAAGPKRLWVSEKIPGGPAGGFGSPVVAGGRVYVYANLKYAVPIATRQLTEDAMHGMGWAAADKLPPAALLETLEKARLGPDRAAKKDPKDLGPWVDQWVKDHLSDAQRTSYGAFCADRLRKGPDAFAIDDLQKLTPLKDQLFASAAAFEQAMDNNGVTGAMRQAVIKNVPVSKDVGKDALYCLDAGDGRTLWCRQYDKIPGKTDNFDASSSTPCIAGGRCYFAGARGALYCLNASDGSEVWATRFADGLQHSSPLVIDGMVILLSFPAYAVQADTGKLVWTQPKAATRQSSPMPWTFAGKHYLLCNNEGDLHCLETATGAMVWSAPGKGYSTIAVAGDVMVAQSGDKAIGLAAYRLTATQAQKIWSFDVTDVGTSPVIHDGYVYDVANGQAVCVGLTDGKVAWNQSVGAAWISCPVLADGKIYTLTDSSKTLLMLRASPAKFESLGKATVNGLNSTSPAIARGRLYLRLDEAVACYDLTAAPAVTGSHP